MRESEPIEAVIARSSLGGYAWCANCKHPDAVHLREMCVGENGDTEWCDCPGLRRMSADEWLAWKYPERVQSLSLDDLVVATDDGFRQATLADIIGALSPLEVLEAARQHVDYEAAAKVWFYEVGRRSGVDMAFETAYDSEQADFIEVATRAVNAALRGDDRT